MRCCETCPAPWRSGLPPKSFGRGSPDQAILFQRMRIIVLRPLIFQVKAMRLAGSVLASRGDMGMEALIAIHQKIATTPNFRLIHWGDCWPRGMTYMLTTLQDSRAAATKLFPV